jgi:hypothetical protein
MAFQEPNIFTRVCLFAVVFGCLHIKFLPHSGLRLLLFLTQGEIGDSADGCLRFVINDVFDNRSSIENDVDGVSSSK